MDIVSSSSASFCSAEEYSEGQLSDVGQEDGTQHPVNQTVKDSHEHHQAGMLICSLSY